MSPEYFYNPATGESEQVVRGLDSQPIEDGPTAQELADIHSARSFENTARHLTQRQNNTADLGESDPAGEIQLLEIQNKIANGQFSSPIEEQMLIQQAEALASKLVGGVNNDPAPTRTSSNQQDGLTDGQRYAEERAAVDDELNEALVNASNVLETEQIERVNDLLGDSDPEVVALAADVVTQVTPNMIASPDATGGAIDDRTYSFIADISSEEIANDAAVLTAAVASGQVSRADAIRTAMHSRPLMEALIAAAGNDELPFTLAL